VPNRWDATLKGDYFWANDETLTYKLRSVIVKWTEKFAESRSIFKTSLFSHNLRNSNITSPCDFPDYIMTNLPTGRPAFDSQYGRDFSLWHVVHTGSKAHLASYSMRIWGFFLGGRAPGAWSWPSSNEAKNAWSYTSTPYISSWRGLYFAQGQQYLYVSFNIIKLFHRQDKGHVTNSLLSYKTHTCNTPGIVLVLLVLKWHFRNYSVF
jgi:hypothetical protein